MKKLLILSGKGGTGKTTTAAAFIRFAGARSVADCDVDAPNLALVSGGYPETRETDFKGSDKAKIDENLCIGCGKCAKMCRFGAISPAGGGKYAVDELRCEGCGLCTEVCPVGAARLDKDIAGSLRVRSGDGVFADAELRMGRGNSGKLVTEVKRALYDAAGEAQLAIIDGSLDERREPRADRDGALGVRLRRHAAAGADGVDGAGAHGGVREPRGREPGAER